MKTTCFRSVPVIFALFGALTLTGCATNRVNLTPVEPAMHTMAEVGDDERVAFVDQDPWERFNRSMYRLNYNFDRYLFLPVVHGYEFVTPSPFQKGISNFYRNIGEFRTVGDTFRQRAVFLPHRFPVHSLHIGGIQIIPV